MNMRKSIFGDYYNYLSKEDSKIYDQVKDSDNEKDKLIKRLIEDKAIQCYNVHKSSKL